ncbi:MAG TPA: cytochrome P450 [Gammaproteobacteria bacterium]|nr:cytochrome P450 [Gammaproteobacteria bacterium]
MHYCDEFNPAFYTLSRYEDVANALRDVDTFSSQFGQGPRFTEPAGMLCDPPQHTFFRKLLQGWFTPVAVEGLRKPVINLTHHLIDNILEGDGNFDAHDDLAFPLPVTIIAQLLGVPDDDLAQFKYWSDIQVAAMGAADPAVFIDDQQAFQSYMLNHFRGKRALIQDGGDQTEDLLAVIAGARDESGNYASEVDALSVLNQLLVGGNETTTSLITNLLWRLLEQPARWEMLKKEPTLIPQAVEESLRYDPPVLGLYRSTTREVKLHGQIIPAGSKVYIHYAAANRDPSVFKEPDLFDLTRPSARHMSFGLGLHFCLGATTARLEAEVALRLLLEKLPNLRLVNNGERIGPFFLWGRKTLPLAWR